MSSVIEADVFEAQSQAFIQWLITSGVEVSDKISLSDLRSSKSGRAVVARQDIPMDFTLFRIPRSLPLTVANSRLATQHPDILKNDSLDPWLSLILCLIYEFLHIQSSPWKPYLDVLPHSFDTLMFWSQQELDQLQASSVRDKIAKQEADQAFEDVLAPIIQQNGHLFSDPLSGGVSPIDRQTVLSVAHRAGSLIMAYAFDVEPVTAVNPDDVDEEGYVSEPEEADMPKAMVALADMLNADGELNNARLFHTPEFLEMRTTVPVPAGDQLFNDYGPLPSSDLLRRYGYVTPRYAQYDVVEIPTTLILDIVSQTSDSEAKSEDCATRLSTLENEFMIDTGYDLCRLPSATEVEISTPESIIAFLPDDFVEAVVSLIASPTDFDRIVRKGKYPNPLPYADSIISILHEAAKRNLARYSTPLGQDRILLDSTTSSSSPPPPGTSARRFEMALRVRIGEKEILQDWITLLEPKRSKRSRAGSSDPESRRGSSKKAR